MNIYVGNLSPEVTDTLEYARSFLSGSSDRISKLLALTGENYSQMTENSTPVRFLSNGRFQSILFYSGFCELILAQISSSLQADLQVQTPTGQQRLTLVQTTHLGIMEKEMNGILMNEI